MNCPHRSWQQRQFPEICRAKTSLETYGIDTGMCSRGADLYDRFFFKLKNPRYFGEIEWNTPFPRHVFEKNKYFRRSYFNPNFRNIVQSTSHLYHQTWNVLLPIPLVKKLAHQMHGSYSVPFWLKYLECFYRSEILTELSKKIN